MYGVFARPTMFYAGYGGDAVIPADPPARQGVPRGFEL